MKSLLILCKMGRHNWIGCKCARCAEIRNEGHEFQPVEGECKQQCSICKRIKDVPHQWCDDKCSRCGAVKGFSYKTFELFDKFFNFINIHFHFLHLEKKDNRVLLSLGFFLMAMFIFIGIMATFENNSNGNGEMHISAPPNELVDEDDKIATSELQEVIQPHVEPLETQKTQEEYATIERQSTDVYEDIAAVSPKPTPTEAQEIRPSTTLIPDTQNRNTIVYITNTGERYHLEYCRTLKQSKTSINIEHAQKRGYTQCGVCRPSD